MAVQIDYWDVAGWCAGCKVHRVNDNTVSHPTFPSLKQMMEKACSDIVASVLVISVNEEEVRTLAWLKKNKFRKGPVVKNWNHGGRKTMLYFKQIPKSIYEEYC